MMTGAYAPHLLYVAAELGLADQLAAGPLPTAELAACCGADTDALGRLLRALAHTGVVVEEEADRWGLTARGQGLRADAPDSQRAWVLLYGGIYQQAWGSLLYSVRSGQPAFPHVFGAPLYAYLADHPAEAALMNATQVTSVAPWLRAVGASDILAKARTVVDVGGGHGALLADVLRAHPQLRGVLLDLPHVVAGAGPLLAQAGVAARCEVIGGDAFVAVPSGGDVYLLSRVLLNWDDQRCVQLLRSIRRAMATHSRLLVVDAVTPPGPLPRGVAEWDVFLLVIFGARVRREPDFQALLHAADLTIETITPLPSQFSVITCRPATERSSA